MKDTLRSSGLALYRTGLIVTLAWLGTPPGPAPEAPRPGTLRTSPTCDHVVGYSGANDCEVELGEDGRIAAVRLLRSGDTPEHVAAVREDPAFFAQFVGLEPTPSSFRQLDGVSRATLTSLAIVEAIALRTSGARTSLRFPEPLRLAELQALVPTTARFEVRGFDAVLFGADDAKLGTVLRTGPGAETITGYQGPTDALVAVDASGRVLGIAIRRSYDNPTYVGYVREDRYFAEQFVGKTLRELAARAGESDPGAPHASDAGAAPGDPEGLDGVSGATMTSLAVGASIHRAAAVALRVAAAAAVPSAPTAGFRLLDFATVLLIAAGCALTFSKLRSHRVARGAQAVAVVIVLGVLGGTMVSLDLLHGWIVRPAPWSRAPALAVLVGVALLTPLTTGRQTYCHQLCPHGAIQRATRRTRWQRPVPRRVFRFLRHLPMVLLGGLGLGLALGWGTPPLGDLEAFGAWAWPLAGWASLTLAGVGILASCVYGMAYCRMGCPTGALLDLIRRRPSGDRFRLRDTVATVLVAVLAVRLWIEA